MGRATRGSGLVPEGELRPFLEQRLPVEANDDLGLLELVGHDLPGAVEVRRAENVGEPSAGESAGRVSPRELPDQDEELRFSLAGVQLKFSVVRADDKITFPVTGRRGDWIAKLDFNRFPGLIENEYSVLEWARRAGFEVPECDIVPTTVLQGSLVKYAEPETFALLVRRYGRLEGARIHQEDFAQVLNARPQNKYGNISYDAMAALIAQILGPEGAAGAEEFIRRLVFVVASGNSDAHLKNWSLIYPDRVQAALAPLYDQVSTVAWPKIMRKLSLELAGVRRFEEVSRDTFTRFAERVGLQPDRVLTVVDEALAAAASAWASAREAGVWKMKADQTEALRDHWRRTPLLAQSPLSGHA